MAQAADQANSAAEYIGSKTQRDSDVMFSPRILEDLDIDPSSAALYVVKDDETMNPVISKGDQVIVDLSKTQIEDGSLYLIHKDGGFWIRRIFREFRNIKLVTESKYLQPITLSPDDLSLVGKVVWIGHRL
jgi:phage repressor protein C with HTH and peptisase S24 domain